MPRYDARTALVVVDVQNDFADPNGSLSVTGGMDVVAVANVEAADAGEAGALVVYTQDWHPALTAHFAKDGGPWPTHCVRDTWGAELVASLTVADDAVVVRKGTGGEDGYSGFTVRDPQSGAESPTELEHQLRHRSIERIVVLGLATDYCVKETALDAVRLGFATTVLRRGVRAVDVQPGDGERALETLAAAGVTVD